MLNAGIPLRFIRKNFSKKWTRYRHLLAIRSYGSIRFLNFEKNRCARPFPQWASASVLGTNACSPFSTVGSGDDRSDSTKLESDKSIKRSGSVNDHQQLVRKLMALISQHSRRMTKTEAVQDYLVTEEDLEVLEYFEAPNPFSRSKQKIIRWYRRDDVEKVSVKKWGSITAMEMEKERQRFEDLRLKHRLQRQKSIEETESFITRFIRGMSGGSNKSDAENSELNDQLHVVNVAIAGNTAVAFAKLFGFGISGSGSMLSEAIHSFADLSNQLLLRVGIQRSYMPSDADHPYGYTLEQYIFGLVSGVGIFFLGCGATVYHGVSLILNPQPLESLPTALAVLGTAGIIESYTLFVAVNAVQTHARVAAMPFWDYVRYGQNPIPVAVMLEDGAAVAGVFIAGCGITLTHITGNVIFDAVGTVAVGGLLGAVAIMLVTKNKDMLVGRSIDKKRLDALKNALMKDDIIDSLHDVKCISVGPSDVRFKAEINFNGWRLAEKYMNEKVDIEEAKGKLQTSSDIELFLLLFGDGLVQQIGDEIDRIEEVIRSHVPEAKHVDIEVL
eukprot:g3894.t1